MVPISRSSIPDIPKLRSLLGLLLVGAVVACDSPTPGEWEDTDFGARRELAPADGEGGGFSVVDPSRTGIDFRNAVAGDRRLWSQILTHGSGVAIGDVDGDGLPDLYLSRVDGDNGMFRNLGGFRFEDITERSGTALPELDGTGVALVDIDGDGDLDLVAAGRGQRNRLLLNDGSGVFTDVTEDSGIEGEDGTSTLAFADVDGDGDLDLYVTNYRTRAVNNVIPPHERTFDQVVSSVDGRYEVREQFRDYYRIILHEGAIELWQYGEPDKFYLNRGNGTFDLVPWTGGRFEDPSGDPIRIVPDDWGLAARFQDLNGDGAPDLYVANDFESPDRLWMNDGTGAFREVGPGTLRTTPFSSMGVDFSDVDRDGQVDILVTDMAPKSSVKARTQMTQNTPPPLAPGDTLTRIQVNHNALLLSRDGEFYQEVAKYAGIDASGWTWGVGFVDIDLDGFEDVLVTTGHVWDVLDSDVVERLTNQTVSENWNELVNQFPPLAEGNVAFRNRGDGTFEDVSGAWGFDVGPDIAHGLAFGDFDRDGDLDVVVSRLDAPAIVFRNEATRPRILVGLRGEEGNTRGIGAKIRVLSDSLPEQTKEITAGGLYLSSPEPVASFAAPGDSVTVVVEWRSGQVSRATVAPGYEYTFDEALAGAAGGEAVEPATAEEAALFEMEALPHAHVEPAYNDFARQPLLPNRLSQLGPGVTWLDWDEDGDDDLLIGSGQTGTIAAFENRNGELVPSARSAPVPFDVGVMLPLGGGPGGADRVLAIQQTYEAESPEAAAAAPGAVWLGVGPNRLVRTGEAIPGNVTTMGTSVAGDLDGDGDLEVFVGARVVPAAYPTPARSAIFDLTPAGLVVNTVLTADIAQVGLVSDAVMTDFDADGDLDLVLAEDWGLVRLFVNVEGRLTEVTAERGLGDVRGRWIGVSSGDFDGDGRMDIVATSWGGNVLQPPSPERPRKLYWGNFDRSGGVDLLPVYTDRNGNEVPFYDLARISSALPYIRRNNVRTFHEFAEASIPELLGSEVYEGARVEVVETLEHRVFLSREDGFESVVLPPEAQFAPSFSPVVGDFDGDGVEDLFLTQNFFGNDNAQRYGEGRGILLRGTGDGGFLAVPASRSGIEIIGDQRGAAPADIDGDGRADLVVTQNGGTTVVLRNRTALPGVRVTLVGNSDNPRAVGARIRLVYADGSIGPAREIKLGEGYWSVGAATQVLGRRGPVEALEVTWPGGEVERVSLSPDQTEITVRREE